jgi:hypothetical protein
MSIGGQKSPCLFAVELKSWRGNPDVESDFAFLTSNRHDWISTRLDMKEGS